MSKKTAFDVFLSHNSKDKENVRLLADELTARKLRVWLDERELRPGQPWQEALEKIVRETGAAAVLVGRDGIGPWQDREMRGCLSEFVGRKSPVIPVLLPNAPEKPDLPLFLRQYTWVDMRKGLTPANIDKLVWGINGVRPHQVPGEHPTEPEPRRLPRWAVGLIACAGVFALMAGLWIVLRHPTLPPGSNKTPGPVPAPSVAVEVALNPTPVRANTPADQDDSKDLRVTYTSTEKDGSLHVGYRLPYLEQQRAGKPMRGVSLEHPPFDWEVPVLSVKVLNNSAQSVMLTQCVAEVTASKIDLEPVILVADRAVEALILVNEGWSDVIDPELRFEIHGLRDQPRPGEWRVLKLGTFGKDCLTRVSKFVPKALDDTVSVAITGEVEYGPAASRKKLPFTTTMVFDVLPKNAIPASYQYDLGLTAGKAPETVVVPVSQNLKPGEADQFLLRVASDKSAHYELKLVIHSIDGRRLAAQDVVLDIFVPRSLANRAEKSSAVGAVATDR